MQAVREWTALLDEIQHVKISSEFDFLQSYEWCSVMDFITTSRRFKCTPNFGVVKYSYIQAIVLSFVEQFPTIQHVSEDRKPFEVGEIFYLLF